MKLVRIENLNEELRLGGKGGTGWEIEGYATRVSSAQ